MNNSRSFTFSASPTGFQSEACTVTGIFQWDFNPLTQTVGEQRSVNVINYTPEQIFSGPGVAQYTFSVQTLDLTLLHQYEGVWQEGHGYRDTLRLQAILYVKYLDSTGSLQLEALHTEECMYAGNRYYEA